MKFERKKNKEFIKILAFLKKFKYSTGKFNLNYFCYFKIFYSYLLECNYINYIISDTVIHDNRHCRKF